MKYGNWSEIKQFTCLLLHLIPEEIHYDFLRHLNKNQSNTFIALKRTKQFLTHSLYLKLLYTCDFSPLKFNQKNLMRFLKCINQYLPKLQHMLCHLNTLYASTDIHHVKHFTDLKDILTSLQVLEHKHA